MSCTLDEMICRVTYARIAKIRQLRFWLRVCIFGWLITLISIAVILYTGKIPPIELQDFGSAYPRNFFEQQ